MQILDNPMFAMRSLAARLLLLGKYRASAALLAVIGVNFVLCSGHDQQRAMQAVFLLAFAGAMVAGPGRLGRAVPRAGVAARSLAGFFLLGALASLNAYSPRFALCEVASLFLLLLAALAVAD